MSSVPGSQVPGRFGTLAHFVEYAVFGALLYAALRVDRSRKSALLLGVAIASAYGITDELHQALVPMRVPDVMDWLVDTAGALAGALAAHRLDEWRERRPRQ
jgi:VanZ family protein